MVYENPNYYQYSVRIGWLGSDKIEEFDIGPPNRSHDSQYYKKQGLLFICGDKELTLIDLKSRKVRWKMENKTKRGIMFGHIDFKNNLIVIVTFDEACWVYSLLTKTLLIGNEKIRKAGFFVQWIKVVDGNNLILCRHTRPYRRIVRIDPYRVSTDTYHVDVTH